MMKANFLMVSFAVAVGAAAPDSRGTEHVLVLDGGPQATIVVADEPLMTHVRTYAVKDGRTRSRPVYTHEFAGDLRDWIEKATGAKLPIVSASQCPRKGTLILFGESGLTKQRGFDCREMPPEGLRIVGFERGVALLGDVTRADERGARVRDVTDLWTDEPNQLPEGCVDRGIGHCTYIFLEKLLGFRFVEPVDVSSDNVEQGTVIPKRSTVSIPADLQFEAAPDFPYRFGVLIDRSVGMPQAFRCFRTGASVDLTVNHTHTMWHRVYGKKHPGIFAPQKDGVPYFRNPRVKPGMKCALRYAHPKVLDIEIQHIDYYDRTGERAVPGRVYATPQTIMFCPADGKWIDHSPEAKPWIDLSKDLFASQSDLVFQYVAKLARHAQKYWPQRRVVAAAYNRYRCPPSSRVRLPNNVDIMLAMCRSSAMTTQRVYWDENEDVIDGWHELLGKDRNRLAVWDYLCWPQVFTNAPVLYPHRLRAWLRHYRNKISGMFVNGGAHHRINHLMYQVWHKLLWDVDMDVDAFIDSHCRDYYGPAGPFVARIYKTAAERYETVQWTKRVAYSSIPIDHVFARIFPPAVVSEFGGHFRRAYAAVSGNEHAAYRRRLDYIYNAGAPDGWGGFMQASARYQETRRPLVIRAAAEWPQARTYELYQGTHVETARPARPEHKTMVQFTTTSSGIVVHIGATVDPSRQTDVESDAVGIIIFAVPAAEDFFKESLDAVQTFLRPDDIKATTKALPIFIRRGDESRPRGVSVKSEVVSDRWVVEIGVPYTVLRVDPAKTDHLLVDVRRAILLRVPEDVKVVLPGGGNYEHPYRIHLALCLRKGFVWTPFNAAQRAARLKLRD